MVKRIIKRDGRVVDFDRDKIQSAIMKAVEAVGGDDDVEASRVTDLVVAELSKCEEEPQVEYIQDLVEKMLIEEGHAATAKEYILYRANRDRVREMNSSLMRTFEELSFGSSNDVELKRENANIDGDTAMGTMLRYGSESAKQFNLSYLVSPDIAKAHRSGDIHIHDLDFMALTETCVSGDTKVIIRDDSNGDIRVVNAEYFDKYLSNLKDSMVKEIDGISIYSGGEFVRLVNCVRHRADAKRVLQIKTDYNELKVTDEHRIPVIRGGEIDVLKAKDIKVGDKLIVDSLSSLDGYDLELKELVIKGIEELEYKGYVYDFETGNHYFSANGVKVHNCCQIDLEKLFKGGFNTGHGYLREPGEIRSYAALACIAIQGNQNEMHGGQSIPAFDHYMAPGVAKSFIKELKKVIDIKYPQCNYGKEMETDDGGYLTNEGIYQELKRYRDKNRLIMNEEGYEFIRGLFRDRYCKHIDDVNDIIKMASNLTDDATHQAMEAVIHNLNSMHCLPYSEKIWVYDEKLNEFKGMEIGKLTEVFEENRYKVVSINKESGKAEFKYITCAKRMDNNRDIVEIRNNQGASVRVTDNHRVMTIRGKEIVEDYPSGIENVISPRGIKTPMVNNDISLEGYGNVRKDSPYLGNHIVVSEEFAELMGYYIADGSLLGDSGTICFTTCGKVSFDRLRELVRVVFGKDLNSHTTTYENSENGTSDKDIRFGIGSRVFRMIDDKFGRGSKGKKIPIEILFATNNIKEEFLKAYFKCDGRKGSKYGEVSSVNGDLINQIAFMMYSLKASPHLRVHTTNGGFKNKDGSNRVTKMYTLSISSEDAFRIGITESNEAKFSIPKYDLSMVPNKITRRRSNNTRYHELEQMLLNGENLEYAHFENFYVNKVVSKDTYNSGDEYVYDISVEDNENFMTYDGLFVHNSRAGAQVVR